ncbi:hypothetical protein [Ruegeria sp. SCP11]|uniref:hypothetical protein n=1 Tax=Ruegeria sp. SCP11 TaxID=3141378 RepID=UPI0033367B72
MENYLSAGCTELVNQSPSDEFIIMSLSRSDPKFQAICRDFGEAVIALRSFEAQGESGRARAVEFQQICKDLRLELMQYVNQEATGPKAQVHR